MSNDPDWLPDLVCLNDYSNNWTRYRDALYGTFYSDFIARRLFFRGLSVSVDRKRSSLGKEDAFWHCITEGQVEEDRELDLRRCERIRWPRSLIEAVSTDRVRWWKTVRGRSERVVIALPDFSYVVVIASRGRFWLLVTAYCVEHESRRRKLAAEFEGAAEKG